MEISVIIPVFNAERFLWKAVQSCLQLTDVKEVILVEDKSQDNSLAICFELAALDKRVKIFQHHDKLNHGRGATRNLGIRNASFQYLSFLDADDFYLPNRFFETAKVFQTHPDADGVYEPIGTYAYDALGDQLHKERMEYLGGNADVTKMDSGIAPKDLFSAMLSGKNGWFHFNGLTVKKSAFKKSGLLNDTFRCNEDDDFFYRLGYFCTLYSGSEKPVAIRGVYDGNWSLDKNYETERLELMPAFTKSLFQLMLTHPMSKKDAWIITVKYLSYIDVEFATLPYGLKRKLIIRLNLLKVLIIHPKLIVKLL